MDSSLIPAFHDALVVARTGSVVEAARQLHKTPLRRVTTDSGESTTGSASLCSRRPGVGSG